MDPRCAISICEFARRYRSEQDRTPRQLYEGTGYDTYHAEITQKDIEATIARDESLVDDWLAFTEDKRWTPSWGLKKQGDTWVVFQLAKGGVRSYEVVFHSPVQACAMMVRMEMEDFRHKAAGIG